MHECEPLQSAGITVMTHLRVVVAGVGQILRLARSVLVLIRKEPESLDIESGI